MRGKLKGWRLGAVVVALVLGLLGTVGAVAFASDDSPLAPGGPQTMIVGGHEVRELPPGAGALFVVKPDGEYNRCGGALIAPRSFLTAADCVSNPPLPSGQEPFPEEYTARIGSTDYASGGYVRKITGVFPLDGWTWTPESGAPWLDLAVVQLDQPVPITPARIGAVDPDREVMLTGWGLQTANPPDPLPTPVVLPRQMHAVDVDILDPKACEKGDIRSDELCMGAGEGKAKPQGSCFGDGGSPGYQRQNGKLVIVVIQTRGSEEPKCAAPSIGTDVGQYLHQVRELVYKSESGS